MDLIKVGIIGAAGYTGGELIRILINHPFVKLGFVHSTSQAGQLVSSTHTDLAGELSICFDEGYNLADVDVMFLCSGHGQSRKFILENHIPPGLKIIDLSTDYRDESDGFVYGLPELQCDKISSNSKIANPGCFATAIQLALLPLAQAGLLNSDIHISAITGSTGAGQALSQSTHFSWRHSNVSIYKPFTHQHLAEIGQSVRSLQSSFESSIHFIPYRGNFTRGIMANVYTSFDGNENEAKNLFERFYENHPFTHLVNHSVDLNMVINTNKCLLEIQKHGNQLLISSVIDNLLKGASGQAIQNMNIMFNLDQKTGLNLKPSAF